LGYSRQERDTLCSLVLVAQRKFVDRSSFEQPFRLDFSPSESWDWDATRDCGVSTRMIARVLGVDRKQVFVIIAACHGHTKSLLSVAELMGFGTDVKQACSRLQTIAGWSDPSNADADSDEDEDGVGGDNDSVSSTSSSVASSASTASSVLSMGARNNLAGVNSASDRIRLSQKAADDLSKFVSGLNQKFLRNKRDKRGSMANTKDGESTATSRKHKLPIKEDTVVWLIHLAHGDIKCTDWSKFYLCLLPSASSTTTTELIFLVQYL